MRFSNRLFSISAALILLALMTAAGTISVRAQDTKPTPTPQPTPEEEWDVPVAIDAPFNPIPVKADDGKWYFVYHLLIWNWSFSDLLIRDVEISDAKTGAVVAHYDRQALSRIYRFMPLFPRPPRIRAADLRRVGPGRTGVLFIGFTVDTESAIPRELKHRLIFDAEPPINLTYEAARDPAGGMVVDNFMVPVRIEKPLVIGPPLRGEWKCGGGIDNNSLHQHQTSLSVLNGARPRIPERFAFDFQKIDEHGDILPNPFPDIINNRMFYGYGAEVLAVADGVVSFVKDGIPENVPQSSGAVVPAVPISGETVAGNHLGIKIAENRYAFYAHLQVGSIRVKVGQRVRRGQVIGLVGNNGNSVGPHLHFHVCDQNSLDGCEGVPYVFDSFELIGRWPENYKPTPTKFEPQLHRRELPLKDRVVRFPDNAPARRKE
jgi:hypothetical protein